MRSKRGFRDRVLKLARASYPSISLEASAQSAEMIIANGVRIGLQNLRAKFDQSDRSQQALEHLVAEYLHVVLQNEPSVPDFETARQKLRPQLMPPEYAEQAPIISLPFGRTLATGIVLDADHSYVYLKREDAHRWNKSHDELLDIAIANLDEASRKMQMQFTENEEMKWIGVDTKDGFDAARILIPKLRGFLASRLGRPFHFGVPNRDVLLCWSSGAAARFSEVTASKIRTDFETQPYPLSPHTFEVSVDGRITERV
jgi:uncharacterized protein YtpQ (UPF0354 family)